MQMRWFQTSQRSIGGFQTTLKVSIPRYCLPEYWEFNKLNYSDILKITDCVPAQYFWICVILIGIKASASAVYPSYSSMCDIIISSKIIAIKKILKKTNILCEKNNVESKLIYSHGHFPPIPFHFLPSEQFELIEKNLVPMLCVIVVHEVTYLFEWENQLWLPREQYDNCIRCQVVITSEEFSMYYKTGPQTMSYAQRPIEILYKNINYVLLSESVLFVREKMSHVFS